jgi:hypothetical protein
MATPDDIVLIAGKGHETYQIFADLTVPFDDRQVIMEQDHNPLSAKDHTGRCASAPASHPGRGHVCE